MDYLTGVQSACARLGLEKTALDGPGYGQTFAGPRTLREAGQQAGVAGTMGAGFVGGAYAAPTVGRGFLATARHMTGGYGPGTNPLLVSLHNTARLEPLLDGSIAYRKARNGGAGVGTAMWQGAKAALPTAANLAVPGRLPSGMLRDSLLRQAQRDITHWDELKDIRNGGTGKAPATAPVGTGLGGEIGSRIRNHFSR